MPPPDVSDTPPVPTFPDDYVDAVADGAIPPGKGVEIPSTPASIALFLYDGSYYALRNECPHQWSPLHEGDITDGDVICPAHGWRFQLATGSYGIAPWLCVDTYDVRVHDGRVWVSRIPRPKPKRPEA